ncbi:MAG: DNA helicase RecQ [Clostridium sp.]|nr:DNA helicase RecQ [Clostridium sp.]
MNQRALEILKKYFGYDAFRAGQESIITTILSGRDCFAVMPTGAGKSVCYQVPGLIFPGITLVVSPLISLMQDQVKALNEAGVHAAYINSSLSEAQISKALSYAEQGRYKMIYVAPERLESRNFLQFAVHAEISMLTVDEAHCISQWGQDFRPSYLKIVNFIKALPKRPVISAFTATATQEVREDVICTLGLEHPNVVVTGFDRGNLYYSVEHVRKKDDFVVDYIEKHPHDSGIIYCATRKNVDNLCELLSKKGVAVTKYHAGLGAGERKRNQEDFIYDRAPVVVATNAFGMGIDKSNVRYVIHYNMPQSMENYYQEAGRAGRDGEPSQCILLFSLSDVRTAKFLLESKDFSDVDPMDVPLIRERDAGRLYAMEHYCKTTGCLRNTILSYFGEETNAPCDNCGNCHRKYREVDMTEQAKQVINCVCETRGRYGLSVVTGTLIGANRAKLREIGCTEYQTYGVLRDLSEAAVRQLTDQMLEDEYLCQTRDTYSVLQLGPAVKSLQNEDTRVMIRMAEEKESERNRAGARRVKSTDALTRAGYELFEKLRALRLEIAREESMPPYIIFNDRTLIDLCVKMPRTKADMLNVSGVGEYKFAKYGQRFLDEVNRFLS